MTQSWESEVLQFQNDKTSARVLQNNKRKKNPSKGIRLGFDPKP